jgi:curved DNA-binding protein CbpA
MAPENPYMVLGVPPTATQAEITRAYRAHLRALHPDTRTIPPISDKRLGDVLSAYRLLRNPDQRADYDRTVERTETARPDPHTSAMSTARHIDTRSRSVQQIPVTHTPMGIPAVTDPNAPPLWAGPVRHHYRWSTTACSP